MNQILNTTTTLVFIDAGVDNYQQLVNGVISTAEVFVLNKTADGIEQINQVLQQRQNIDAVHIISHGAPGQVFIGQSSITLDELTESNVGQWQQYLSGKTEILLYGCNVADGVKGRQFINRLEKLTGAVVYASDAVVGSSDRGGSWKLASFIRAIDLEILPTAFSTKVLATYQGAFGQQIINPTGGGSGSDDLKVIIFDDGRFQVERDGFRQVYGSTPNSSFGLALAVDNITYAGSSSDSFDGNQSLLDNPKLKLINQSSVSGSGSSVSPYQVTTTLYADVNDNNSYDAATDFRLEWVASYVDPDDYYSNEFNITAPVGNTSQVKLYQGFDSLLAGGDSGAAYGLTASNTELTGTTDDPKFIGVTKNSTVMGFIENQGEFSHWYSGFFGTPDDQIDNGGNLTNTYDTDPTTDNGIAVQYDLGAVSGTTTISNFLAFSTDAIQNIVNAGIVVNQNNITVGEDGTTATFTVQLQDAPTSNVVLDLSSSDTTEATLSTSTLTFTSTNWNTPQTVTVSGVSDGVVDGDQNSIITLSVNDASSDDDFDGLSRTINVTTTDTINQAPTALSLSNNSINENVAADSVVGSFNTTDADVDDTFTYSLVSGVGNTDNTDFTVVGNQLQINASPDFETKSTYNIRVRTTDSGGLGYEETLTINVKDFNEIGATPNKDNLQGTSASDQIDGLEDKDYIKGKEGDDELKGGADNDRVYGGVGSDTLSGNTGNDFLKAGIDDDLLSGGDGRDRLLGGTGNDTLTGGAGNDFLKGGDGSDSLDGGSGKDRLYGGTGNDILTGGSGKDTLFGGEGADLIIGVDVTSLGTGDRDKLTGDAGADTFVLGNASGAFYNDDNDSKSGKSDYALILDFETEDTIQLHGNADDYILDVSRRGTSIYLNNDGVDGLTRNDELIGIIKGVTLENMDSGFRFVGGE